MARGGYSSLAKVLSGMDRLEIINMVKASGLRGRGGGGFPTGLNGKLRIKAKVTSNTLFVTPMKVTPERL